jgi:dTDP-4-amino-4,6-dideoxygalactose transaminase
MKIPFIDLKTQYLTIKDEVKKEFNDIFDTTSFILGEKVKNFENNFASYCNKKYAIAVNSGTSALHLALVAKNIKQNDEVITVSNTFIATAEAISYMGAKPVFVDIDPLTYTIDVNKIEEAITKKTKAIIPVHIYGHPCDMDRINSIAKKYNLEIIEDCCQAHGTEYKGKKVPIYGIGCFSFYPSKNLGTYGEGGAVVTDDEEIAEKILMLRNHGQKEKYYHKYIGYNYRMDEFHGAVLGVKLNYLDKWTEMRRVNAKLYTKLLSGIVNTPVEIEYAKHVYYLYTIRVKEREKLIEHLKSKDIVTVSNYSLPLYLQEAYSFMGIKKGTFPETERAALEIVALPMYPEISEEQIKYVASAIKEAIKWK